MSSLKEYLANGWSDSCTRIILIALAVVFVYYISKVIHIAFITYRIKVGKKQKNDTLNILKNNKITRFLARDYARTIQVTDGSGNKKTSEFASDYFNLKTILTASKVNHQAMGAAAGILVGIGVLGTFIGLTVGLSQMKVTGGMEVMQKSVDGLLAGMTTAFLTSVAGMLLSSIYTIAEKTCLSWLTEVCTKISDFLDESYYISDQEKQDLLINKLFSVLKGKSPQGEPVTMGAMMQSVSESAARQSVILEEMAKNFCPTDEEGHELTIGNMLREIKTSCDKQRSMIESVLEEFCENLSSAIEQNAVGPLMQKLDELTEVMKKPASTMASDIGEKMRTSIEKMVDDLKNSVSTATTEKLDILSFQLDRASGALSTLPEAMQKLTVDMQTNLVDINKQVSDMNIQTARVGKSLVEQQAGLNAESNKLMESFKDCVKNMSAMVQEVKGVLVEMEKVQVTARSFTNTMESASSKVEKSVDNLQNSQDSFIQSYTDSVQITNRAFADIQTTMQRSEQIIAKHAEELKEIETSLDGVFNQMNEGLSEYSSTVKSDTEKYLNQYSASVAKLAESLEGTFGELSETLDKLPQVLHGGVRR